MYVSSVDTLTHVHIPNIKASIWFMQRGCYTLKPLWPIALKRYSEIHLTIYQVIDTLKQQKIIRLAAYKPSVKL